MAKKKQPKKDDARELPKFSGFKPLAAGLGDLKAKLDQEKQKSGFGWFQGTQMTLTGEMGFMANGKEITAIDRMKHAEGTRERHRLEMAAYKITSDLRKHPAIAEAKKLKDA